MLFGAFGAPWLWISRRELRYFELSIIRCLAGEAVGRTAPTQAPRDAVAAFRRADAGVLHAAGLTVLA